MPCASRPWRDFTERRIASQRPVERPDAGFVLSLVGGLIVTAGSIYGLLTYSGYYYFYGGSPYQIYGVAGLISGVGILIGCATAYLVPRHHVAWGIMIIVFGVAAIFSVYGGLSGLGFFGIPVALIGGSFTVAWKPGRGFGFEDYRTCLACGRHVRIEYPVCPFCGTRAGAIPQGPGIPPGP